MPIIVFAIDPVISFVPGFGTVAHAFSRSFFRSGFCRYKSSLGVLGGWRSDGDHAVAGVSAPQCGPRAANDFDAFHVFEHDVLHVPVDAREERRVDTAAIDQDKQLVVEPAVESSGADGPLVLVN